VSKVKRYTRLINQTWQIKRSKAVCAIQRMIAIRHTEQILLGAAQPSIKCGQLEGQGLPVAHDAHIRDSILTDINIVHYLQVSVQCKLGNLWNK
jgi:hypothetical protein